MKNLAIGFIVGYLVCVYMYGGAEAVVTFVEETFTQISEWASRNING